MKTKTKESRIKDSWLKDFTSKEKESIKIDFKSLFEDGKFTIQSFAAKIGYTVNGAVLLITRGTISRIKFERLKETLPNLEKYVIERDKK